MDVRINSVNIWFIKIFHVYFTSTGHIQKFNITF